MPATNNAEAQSAIRGGPQIDRAINFLLITYFALGLDTRSCSWRFVIVRARAEKYRTMNTPHRLSPAAPSQREGAAPSVPGAILMTAAFIVPRSANWCRRHRHRHRPNAWK